jgi:hypothetical protein
MGSTMMMRTVAQWLTPVKTSGMAAYFIASFACARSAARAAETRTRRLAAAICALDVGLLLDIAFNWRWKLYDSLKDDAVSLHWYDQRSELQIAALVALAVALIVAAGWLSRRFATVRGAPLVICGALLSVGCWLTEVISLHATDAVLYRQAGPLMVVSFIWMLACGMTAAGIMLAA